MRFLHAACWFVLLSTIIASAGERPTLQDGRLRIKKLGTIDVDKVENAPILFRGKLYRCDWWSAMRVNADQGIRVRLIGNWRMNFEFDLRYNSRPVDDRKQTDTTMILGFSYDFKP